MSKSITVIILTALISCMVALTASAQSKPRWVSQGVKSLNKQRSNDTYTFVMLNTHDPDLGMLKKERARALKDYVTDTYGAQPSSIEVKTYSTDPLIYEVKYAGQDSTEYKVIARLVDEYEEFDDFELNVFQFEFYQLYAVSLPNVLPRYDDYRITNTYDLANKCLGIVPGLSQIYKGQSTKGYTIIGGEVFFVGATLIFDGKRRDAKKMKYEDSPEFTNSWRSKERGWKNFEIGAISCAGILYIYNLIDAFTSKGASQVIVKKRADSASYSLTPYFSPDDVGVSFVLNF